MAKNEIGNRSYDAFAIGAGDKKDGGVVHKKVSAVAGTTLLELNCRIVFDILLAIAAVVKQPLRPTRSTS